MGQELKDVIIGVVDNYNWDKIKYWANSINASGFTGHKALIVYNMDADTVKILEKEQFILIGAGEYDPSTGFKYPHPSDRIMVDRFFHIYNFLNLLANPEEVNRVIITDVRDVVFQDNPTTRLDELLVNGHEIILGSENLKYKDEPWGANNMKQSFGQYFYEQMADKEIFCAGVIAGMGDAVKDFCLNLWMICRGSNAQIPGGGGPDQAALNVILNMIPWYHTTYRSNHKEGWACQSGTVADPNKINDFRPHIVDCEPVWDGEFVKTPSGKKYVIVHQYNRVPEWKQVIEKKYDR